MGLWLGPARPLRIRAGECGAAEMQLFCLSTSRARRQPQRRLDSEPILALGTEVQHRQQEEKYPETWLNSCMPPGQPVVHERG